MKSINFLSVEDKMKDKTLCVGTLKIEIVENKIVLTEQRSCIYIGSKDGLRFNALEEIIKILREEKTK